MMNKLKAIILAIVMITFCTSISYAAVAPKGQINFGTFAVPSITKTVYSLDMFLIIDELIGILSNKVDSNDDILSMNNAVIIIDEIVDDVLEIMSHAHVV